MAKNARPIFFSDEALLMIRPHDRMSARVNQIFERYATIVAAQRAAVLEEIGEDNLLELARCWPIDLRSATAGAVMVASNVAHEISEQLGEKVDALSASSAMTLLELIEERSGSDTRGRG